jgi:hypothetical protein
MKPQAVPPEGGPLVYECVKCGLRDPHYSAIQIHQIRESHYSGIDILGGVIDRMPIEGGTNFPTTRLTGQGHDSTVNRCRRCNRYLNNGECIVCDAEER